MKIKWGRRAEKQFFSAVEYIRNDSEQNAENVARNIVQIINKLPQNPERYGLDKNKQPNDGSYRYFTKYKYRISYRINKREIKIIRIWHEKRKPKKY